MIENIVLKDFPQKSGVYCFVNMNDEVIYVGSTKNIYDRMRGHRCNIKRGCNGTNSPKEQKNLYKFLQNHFILRFAFYLYCNILQASGHFMSPTHDNLLFQ